MRGFIVSAALLGLAAAFPRPQGIDFASFDAAEDAPVQGPSVEVTSEKVSFDVKAAASELAADILQDGHLGKRAVDVNAPCAPQPDGFGPATNDPEDTPKAFLENPVYSNAANNIPTPINYARTFVNLQGSTQQNGYLGLYTLQTYSTAECATKCDNTKGCMSFNLYFERDPTLNPSATATDYCPNPRSFTNIKCTLYGYPIAAGSATNTGQYREQFQVVIAGSNGYTKPGSASPIDGWSGPENLKDAAINAPDNSYIRTETFKNSAIFAPELCAASCKAMTEYNRRHPRADGTYTTCNFFNAYILTTNGVGQATVCAYHSKYWDPTYAKNKGQWRGKDFYGITSSYTYVLPEAAPPKPAP